MIRTLGLLTSIILFVACTPKKTNVLFIVVDDLRPELHCYGKDIIQSPNIDKLASEGVLFTNAHCNVPVCGASRASFLTGMRPTRSRFLTYESWVEKDVPEAMTIPGYFKQQGYTTVSNGKVFHNQEDHKEDWDINWRPGPFLDYQFKSNRQPESGSRGLPYEDADVADSVYNDGKIANKSINDLRQLAEKGRPFFMAVGFYKPHLPFNAPRKYWDIYQGKVHEPYNNFVPINAPSRSIHNWGELRSYYGVPAEGPVSDSMAVTLIQGYYACVSYVDAQIGKVLDELKKLGLDENTQIVLIGDHGWNLLEHTLWCKHCNYRTSLRSVMIMKSPQAKAGSVSDAIVEYIDIFPTLVDLTGGNPPSQLQGKSLVPELKSPNTSRAGFAVSAFHGGYTLTTRNYAYTEWVDDSLHTQARMLYNHRSDLDENENVAEKPENSKVVDSLHTMLRQKWALE